MTRPHTAVLIYTDGSMGILSTYLQPGRVASQVGDGGWVLSTWFVTTDEHLTIK